MYLEIERILELNKDVLKNYSHLILSKQYLPNEIVFKKGEILTEGFFVKNGIFKLCGISKSGRESVIDFYFKKDFFIPFSFLINTAPSITSVVACESNFAGTPELLSISSENYRKILADSPELSLFAESILYNMVQRMLNHHIFEKNESRIKKKNIKQMHAKHHPVVASGLKQKDISSYFGITDVFYSQILSELYQSKNSKIT